MKRKVFKICYFITSHETENKWWYLKKEHKVATVMSEGILDAIEKLCKDEEIPPDNIDSIDALCNNDSHKILM
jgi:hypothetical protein